MIQSMTGFGRTTGTFENKKISVEVRSLNSKQADINIKLPQLYKEKELVIRNQVISSLGRGKIELSIYVESDGSEKKASVNKELLKTYYADLKEVADDISITDNVEFLSILMRMPDVLKSERPELSEVEWDTVNNLIGEALENINAFRTDEGKSLESDLRDRVGSIRSKIKDVEKYEEERINTVKERIQKNLEDWAGKENIDVNRFEQEMIYYLEKYDVSEEKVRLNAHCNYFEETMEGNSSQGKKLGFISQEMGREINTTGSKANHAEIQKLVVEMKDDLEKIKEQVLNVL